MDVDEIRCVPGVQFEFGDEFVLLHRLVLSAQFFSEVAGYKIGVGVARGELQGFSRRHAPENPSFQVPDRNFRRRRS